MTAATADWLTKDFYAVLGVAPDATDRQITSAYRTLARELHPDTRTGGGSDDRFKEVAAAYAVLGSEATRREYDEVRAAAAQRPSGWGGYRIRVHTPRRDDGRGAHDGDLLGGMSVEDLLGGFVRGHASSSAPRRGRDLQATVRLTFEQAVRGATVDVPVDGGRTVPRGCRPASRTARPCACPAVESRVWPAARPVTCSCRWPSTPTRCSSGTAAA